MKSISKDEAAYLAGIIDGEGCIQISRNGSKYAPRLEITSISPTLLQRVSEIYMKLGVKFCFAYHRNPQGKESLRLIVQSLGSSMKVIAAILPYLTAKREEALIFHDLLVWRREHLPERLGRYSANIEEWRFKLHTAREQLMALKSRRFDLQRLPKRASCALDLSRLEAKV